MINRKKKKIKIYVSVFYMSNICIFILFTCDLMCRQIYLPHWNWSEKKLNIFFPGWSEAHFNRQYSEFTINIALRIFNKKLFVDSFCFLLRILHIVSKTGVHKTYVYACTKRYVSACVQFNYEILLVAASIYFVGI